MTVKDGSTTLIEGVDYTVAYPNASVNAGTYKIVVTLQGNYIGDDFETTYKIAAKKITPTVTLTPNAFVYNGKVRKPAVTVKDGSTRLSATNYTVKYSTGRKNPGAYKVTVTMKGNYSGIKTVSFRINPKGTALVSLTPASKKMTVKWKKQARIPDPVRDRQ